MTSIRIFQVYIGTDFKAIVSILDMYIIIVLTPSTSLSLEVPT